MITNIVYPKAFHVFVAKTIFDLLGICVTKVIYVFSGINVAITISALCLTTKNLRLFRSLEEGFWAARELMVGGIGQGGNPLGG